MREMKDVSVVLRDNVREATVLGARTASRKEDDFLHVLPIRGNLILFSYSIH